MGVGVDGEVAVGTKALRLLRREVEIGRVHHQSGLLDGQEGERSDGVGRERSRTGGVDYTCLHVQQREGGRSTCTFRHGVRSVIYSAGERKVGGMEPSETPRVIESWLRNIAFSSGGHAP